TLKAHKVAELPLEANKSMATLIVDQNFPTEQILGVDYISVILKYDHMTVPYKDIPGVANDDLMNEWMLKAGTQGYGSWCASPTENRCAYGYGLYSIPVDFVKFIDLNEVFSDFYYFNSNGYFDMNMDPFEERSLNLRMENPYTEQTVFELSSITAPAAVPAGHETISFHKGIPPANKTTTATLAAATSDKYVVNNEYYLQIKAPASGKYDINVMAKAHGITDKVRVRLIVKSPPNADFIAIPKEGVTPLVVDFFDKSTDDGTIIAWQWAFGDGSTSSAQNPSHTYNSEGPLNGAFKVKLTVTDDMGLKDTIEKEIQPYAKIAISGFYVADIFEGNQATISASCTKDQIPGIIQVTDESGVEIFKKDNHKCNNPGTLKTSPIEKSGIYLASYTLNAPNCTACQKTQSFLVAAKMQELQTPENPLIEIAVCIIILFGFMLKQKKE
ncbi:MAG: PKD domain-containing protein, partial [Candidatus Diapherotrites archaeon]